MLNDAEIEMLIGLLISAFALLCVVTIVYWVHDAFMWLFS